MLKTRIGIQNYQLCRNSRCLYFFPFQLWTYIEKIRCVIHLRQGRKHEEKENVVGDHDDDDLRVYLVHNLLCKND